MLEIRLGGIPIRISVLFPAMVVFLLSADPSHTALSCLFASLLHEAGHALTMLTVNDRPCRVTVGIFGVTIERDRTRYPGYAASAAVSLAGPLVNVLCCVILQWCDCSSAAFIHAVLGVFNLLPIVSLDGGEALYAVLCLRCSERTALRTVRVTSVITVFPLAVFGFFCVLTDIHNVSLLLISGYLILLLFFKEKH